MKKKGKGTDNNYKREGEIIPNRKHHSFHDCDTNRKCLLQADQTNHNPND